MTMPSRAIRSSDGCEIAGGGLLWADPQGDLDSVKRDFDSLKSKTDDLKDKTDKYLDQSRRERSFAVVRST